MRDKQSTKQHINPKQGQTDLQNNIPICGVDAAVSYIGYNNGIITTQSMISNGSHILEARNQNNNSCSNTNFHQSIENNPSKPIRQKPVKAFTPDFSKDEVPHYTYEFSKSNNIPKFTDSSIKIGETPRHKLQCADEYRNSPKTGTPVPTTKQNLPANSKESHLPPDFLQFHKDTYATEKKSKSPGLPVSDPDFLKNNKKRSITVRSKQSSSTVKQPKIFTLNNGFATPSNIPVNALPASKRITVLQISSPPVSFKSSSSSTKNQLDSHNNQATLLSGFANGSQSNLYHNSQSQTIGVTANQGANEDLPKIVACYSLNNNSKPKLVKADAKLRRKSHAVETTAKRQKIFEVNFGSIASVAGPQSQRTKDLLFPIQHPVINGLSNTESASNSTKPKTLRKTKRDKSSSSPSLTSWFQSTQSSAPQMQVLQSCPASSNMSGNPPFIPTSSNSLATTSAPPWHNFNPEIVYSKTVEMTNSSASTLLSSVKCSDVQNNNIVVNESNESIIQELSCPKKPKRTRKGRATKIKNNESLLEKVSPCTEAITKSQNSINKSSRLEDVTTSEKNLPYLETNVLTCVGNSICSKPTTATSTDELIINTMVPDKPNAVYTDAPLDYSMSALKKTPNKTMSDKEQCFALDLSMPKQGAHSTDHVSENISPTVPVDITEDEINASENNPKLTTQFCETSELILIPSETPILITDVDAAHSIGTESQFNEAVVKETSCTYVQKTSISPQIAATIPRNSLDNVEKDTVRNCTDIFVMDLEDLSRNEPQNILQSSEICTDKQVVISASASTIITNCETPTSLFKDSETVFVDDVVRSNKSVDNVHDGADIIVEDFEDPEQAGSQTVEEISDVYSFPESPDVLVQGIEYSPKDTILNSAIISSQMIPINLLKETDEKLFETTIQDLEVQKYDNAIQLLRSDIIRAVKDTRKDSRHSKPPTVPRQDLKSSEENNDKEETTHKKQEFSTTTLTHDDLIAGSEDRQNTIVTKEGNYKEVDITIDDFDIIMTIPHKSKSSLDILELDEACCDEYDNMYFNEELLDNKEPARKDIDLLLGSLEKNIKVNKNMTKKYSKNTCTAKVSQTESEYTNLIDDCVQTPNQTSDFMKSKVKQKPFLPLDKHDRIPIIKEEISDKQSTPQKRRTRIKRGYNVQFNTKQQEVTRKHRRKLVSKDIKPKITSIVTDSSSCIVLYNSDESSGESEEIFKTDKLRIQSDNAAIGKNKITYHKTNVINTNLLPELKNLLPTTAVNSGLLVSTAANLAALPSATSNSGLLSSAAVNSGSLPSTEVNYDSQDSSTNAMHPELKTDTLLSSDSQTSHVPVNNYSDSQDSSNLQDSLRNDTNYKVKSDSLVFDPGSINTCSVLSRKTIKYEVDTNSIPYPQIASGLVDSGSDPQDSLSNDTNTELKTSLINLPDPGLVYTCLDSQEFSKNKVYLELKTDFLTLSDPRSTPAANTTCLKPQDTSNTNTNPELRTDSLTFNDPTSAKIETFPAVNDASDSEESLKQVVNEIILLTSLKPKNTVKRKKPVKLHNNKKKKDNKLVSKTTLPTNIASISCPRRVPITARMGHWKLASIPVITNIRNQPLPCNVPISKVIVDPQSNQLKLIENLMKLGILSEQSKTSPKQVTPLSECISSLDKALVSQVDSDNFLDHVQTQDGVLLKPCFVKLEKLNISI